jgi:hypothetical protein
LHFICLSVLWILAVATCDVTPLRCDEAIHLQGKPCALRSLRRNQLARLDVSRGKLRTYCPRKPAEPAPTLWMEINDSGNPSLRLYAFALLPSSPPFTTSRGNGPIDPRFRVLTPVLAGEPVCAFALRKNH